MYRSTLLLLCTCLLSFGFASNVDAKRVALIIGNSAYEHAPELPNPANDASDLAAAFSAMGYQVRLVKDASREHLLNELRLFRYESLGAEHSIIYYAGHGVEIGRQNYLVPVDAKLKSDIDVEYEALSLNLLVSATSGANNLQLVVLDACRDNPFLDQMTRTVATRSIGRGLALYEPNGNSLVAYSAKEGTVALDGSGTNSPYAEAFLSALEQPQLEIGQFFRTVRDNVVRKTNRKQEPFLYGSLSADPVYFHPVAPKAIAKENATPKKVETDQQDKASQNVLLSIDLAFWESIRGSQQAKDFQDYLERFPNGQFGSLAKRRLAAISPATSPAPREISPSVAVEASTPTPLTEIELSRTQARNLQARLNILGFSAGGEDGLIGKRTLSAIAAFRTSTGIEGGNHVDQNLLNKIRSDVPDSQLVSYQDQKRKQATRVTKTRVKSSTKAKNSSQAPAPSVQKVESTIPSVSQKPKDPCLHILSNVNMSTAHYHSCRAGLQRSP